MTNDDLDRWEQAACGEAYAPIIVAIVARTAIPKLIAEVKRLQAILDARDTDD